MSRRTRRRRARELEVYDGPPISAPPPTPLPEIRPRPERPTSMSAYVIGIYDIVRRMCADHAFGAHATDVALQAVEEGLVEGTTLEGIIFEVRFALDYLRAHGIIEIQRFAANTFVVKEDLLTVMSKVL